MDKPMVVMTDEQLRGIVEKTDEAVKRYVKEYASISAVNLTERITPKILEIIKPFTQSKEEILNDELSRATVIITEVNKTWLGWLLLKRIEKKLRKQEAEKNNG